MSHGGCHFPNLPVPAFRERDPEPTGWDGLSETDRFGARREAGLAAQDLHLGRPRAPSLNNDPVSKLRQRLGRWFPLDLNQVRTCVSEPRVQQAVFQLVVVRQEQQAFAVGIEPSDRVDVLREWPEFAERLLAGCTRELGEDSVRFVEEDVVKSRRLQVSGLAVQCSREEKKNPSSSSRDRINSVMR
jgi:hypothetical protein